MAIYLSCNKVFNESDIASKINQATISIMENISTVTPETLAAEICMGYSNFRKIFKKYTGFAPLQYIQEVKINLAKEMLTHTNKTIKEIALELGFENNDYFFTDFRRTAGVTPVNYRKITQGGIFSEDIK